MEKLAAAMALQDACSGVANKRLHTRTHELQSSAVFPLRREGWAGDNNPPTTTGRGSGGGK